MFKKISQNRIYKDIVDQILETIFAGELHPGEKLPSEKELQKVFGVSRVTVREALQSLEQYGIIEVRQGSRGGAFIKKIDLNAVLSQMETALKMTNLTLQQVTDARIAIEETILLKLLPGKIKAEDLDRLEKNLAKTEAGLNDTASPNRVMDTFDFHTMVAEITENPIIIMIYQLIHRLLGQFFDNTETSDDYSRDKLEEHKEILHLLKQGNFDAASHTGIRHILKGSLTMAETFRQQSIFTKEIDAKSK